MIQKIILASQSPRGKQLLEWAEIPFEVIAQSTDESFPAGMPIEEVPVYIAKNKAEAVKNCLDTVRKQMPVLAADTIVVLNEKIIGKPKDRNEAIDILASLSANKHKVITGVVILYDRQLVSFEDTTEVT